MAEPKRFPALFYSTSQAREPVREWLRGLPREERRVVGIDLQRLEYRWPVGMPLSRPLGGGVQELRSSLPGGRIARVLFFVDEEHLILVHGFIKKTQTTPKQDLDLARRRKRDWERHDA